MVWGAFLNSGQTCIRPDHCLVEDSVADKFIALCKETIAEFYTTDAQKSECFGRIINDSAWERLNGIIEKSKDKIIVGGKTDKTDRFIAPTILDYGTDANAFDSCAAMQDELFGPILPVFRFRDYEKDVIQRIRDLPTGKPLALYIFAQDKERIDMTTRRLTSGGMCVNDVLVHIVNADLGFGGVGASGMGSYHGERSMKAFSHEKTVVTKYPSMDQSPALKWVLDARFPPWNSTRKSLVGVVTNPTLSVIKEYMESPNFSRLVLALLVVLIARKLGFRLVRD